MSTTNYDILVNHSVTKLKPYQPGKPIATLRRELNITGTIIKLASNENSLGPSPKAIAALQTVQADLFRYPDGSGFDLKQALAKIKNIPAEQIVLGNGSDDNFNFIIRAFANSTDEIIMCQYGFAAFAIAAKACGVNLKLITPDESWCINLDEIIKSITNKTKIIYIANPNNPTGTWVNKQQLENFLSKIPKNIIVVIDQAYFEYMRNYQDYPNGINYLQNYPNLIVTHTFSKAYGLAGLRIGYSISSPKLADFMNRVRLPFNVNSLGLIAATAALTDSEHISQTIEFNNSGKQQLLTGCINLGLNCISKAGNFVTIEFNNNAEAIYNKLLESGIIVRPLAPYGMHNYLRVSIGTESENAKFLHALYTII